MEQFQPRRARVKGEHWLGRKGKNGFKTKVHDAVLYLTICQVSKSIIQGCKAKLESCPQQSTRNDAAAFDEQLGFRPH